MICSALMVPADKEKLLLKIPNLACDTVMINLEDGVYDKKTARQLLQKTLPMLDTNKKIVVRVNALDECGKDDITYLSHIERIDAFRIPKVYHANDVLQALQLTSKEIHLSIETKEAFQNIASLKISNRVTTVYLGILDLFNSLGLPHSLIHLQNPTIDYILSKFLIDSLGCGFFPVSFIYQDHQNLEAFEAWCTKEKQMGFRAKGCISPKQVDVVNQIFGAIEDITKAAYIKQIFEAKQSEGISGFVDEKYGFIDEPIYKNAVQILLSYEK